MLLVPMLVPMMVPVLVTGEYMLNEKLLPSKGPYQLCFPNLLPSQCPNQVCFPRWRPRIPQRLWIVGVALMLLVLEMAELVTGGETLCD